MAQPSQASDIVFFKVTNLEYDVLDVDTGSLAPGDSYIAATLGELGVWIDSKVTKMMQTGLEHSRVPDAASFLATGRFPTCDEFTGANDQPSQASCLCLRCLISRRPSTLL